MHWLQDIDLALLRFINQTLSNRYFDALMPFASGNAYFFPVVVFTGLLLLWKGGKRARLCLLMLALIVGPGDGLITNTIKHAIERPRPFVTHSDILQPASKAKRELKSVEDIRVQQAEQKPKTRKPNYNSMPSAHAANWAAVTMIFLVYYRRSLWITLPLACLVSFSRIYNGVHYPSDVLVGAILGAGYAAAGMWGINALWRSEGRRLFPLWWQKVPSLIHPEANAPTEQSPIANPKSTIDQHWLRLGWALIIVVFFARLAYLASDTILLSEDEAYQWLWSKHLALSYYSKPFGIALAQWIGTSIWGDTAFGIRFLSPVLSAAVSIALLHFVARWSNGRTAFLFTLICLATPLLSVGGIMMTIDPLVVFFWIMAMLAAWQAIIRDSTRWWIVAGICLAGEFLSKYFSPFQWASFALFFALCKPARAQLRRPGPWLALGINALATLPVILWNHQHGWITLTHLKERGNLQKVGHFTLRYFTEFVGGELGLVNIVFGIAILWAITLFIRRDLKERNSTEAPRQLELFLFCQGIVVLAFYTLDSLRSRVQLNWPAACVAPLLLFATLWWYRQWKAGSRAPIWLLSIGLAIGLPLTIIGHNTDLIETPMMKLGKAFPKFNPGRVDPLHRLRGHDQVAKIVQAERAKLLTEGKPVFVIADHYGRAGLLNFYLPEARPFVSGEALVTVYKNPVPKNQLWFWPGYDYADRTNQNALFVAENDKQNPPPEWLTRDFESVTDLGLFDINYHGRDYNRIQIFVCRNKR